MTCAQTEHDLRVLNTVLDDLLQDYRNTMGHMTLIDNTRMIEEAADKFALLLEKLRSASTARVIDLRQLETINV